MRAPLPCNIRGASPEHHAAIGRRFSFRVQHIQYLHRRFVHRKEPLPEYRPVPEPAEWKERFHVFYQPSGHLLPRYPYPAPPEDLGKPVERKMIIIFGDSHIRDEGRRSCKSVDAPASHRDLRLLSFLDSADRPVFRIMMALHDNALRYICDLGYDFILYAPVLNAIIIRIAFSGTFRMIHIVDRRGSRHGGDLGLLPRFLMCADRYPPFILEDWLRKIVKLKLIEEGSHLFGRRHILLKEPHAVYLPEIRYFHILLEILLPQVMHLALEHEDKGFQLLAGAV